MYTRLDEIVDRFTHEIKRKIHSPQELGSELQVVQVAAALVVRAAASRCLLCLDQSDLHWETSI